MTITVETITELDDDIFNSLYADSVDDLGAGSMMFPEEMNADEKKAFMKSMLEKNTMVLFKNDTTPIIYANGNILPEYAYYENGDWQQTKHTFTNLFYWTHAIFGNVDGNKNWVRTAEFFTNMKAYLVSEHSVDGMLIEAVKGQALATSFKQSQANGVCQGTYSINSGGATDSLIWVY